MYSSFAATAGADALDENTFLFNQAGDDVFPMPMSHDGEQFTAPGPNIIPITGFSKPALESFGAYTPSPTPYGDHRDDLGANGDHADGGEHINGTTSHGSVKGQGRGWPSSSLYFPHALPSSRSVNHSDHASVDAASNHYQSPYPSVTATQTAASAPPPQPNHGNPVTDSALNGDMQLHPRSKPLPTPETAPSASSSDHQPTSRKTAKTRLVEVRPNSSIPALMTWEEFGRQCILAAESSRLNPFALHPEEYKLLRSHINHAQVTLYLNIRNAILRLWTRNPLVRVTLEEAAGCARDKRYFGLAEVAYYWLLRNGYINFGCLNASTGNEPDTTPRTLKGKSQKTIVVIGAGMSGLGCARQMEGLSLQLGDQWAKRGERPPKIIVLEARPRIGGRVYSHPLRNQNATSIPAKYRCTAEMGAQIITGFERGNPMNTLVRGQLGIPYHGLRDNTILYDHDGTVVDKQRDKLVENLYNDVLERASVYRSKPATSRTVEGDRNLIMSGREPNDNGGPTVAVLEMSETPLPANADSKASKAEDKPASGVEKLAGRAYQLSAGFNPDISAAKAMQNIGWKIKKGTLSSQTIDLDPASKSSEYPTLGETMDEGIRQYQDLLDIRPQDLRLLNWHHANLEYANAVNVNQLSLSGWDQDIGNEFEGEHTEVIGGYQQVPRGLWKFPRPLDVRFRTAVKTIRQKVSSTDPIEVVCHNGDVYAADEVVLTTPLGVLKSGSVTFDPPLPSWKQSVIERMGFGLLNKIVLVYEEAFWEPHRDMFGLLNDAEQQASLDAKDYRSRRGRFYLFWNCIKTSGRPMLVALMAGDAAHYAEATPDDVLVQEVTDRLAKVFAPSTVPPPSETIVTRWSKDPYARGTYSYVGPQTLPGDYNVMAKPHGHLHFAGEATCGTHPATVHGAYLSGLRAASEVIDSMLGPIEVPIPLVDKKVKYEPRSSPVANVATVATSGPGAGPKLKKGYQIIVESSVSSSSSSQSASSKADNRIRPSSRDEDYEASIIGAILSKIGERPLKPNRNGATNPFLLFTKDHWYPCKKDLDEVKQAGGKNPEAKATRTEIRAAVGLKWRTCSAEVRQPYIDQAETAKVNFGKEDEVYRENVEKWDREAARIREEYIKEHPPGDEGTLAFLHARTAIEAGSSGAKRVRRI